MSVARSGVSARIVAPRRKSTFARRFWGLRVITGIGFRFQVLVPSVALVCLFGVCVPRLAEPEYFWYDTALLLRRLGLNLVCVVFNGYGYAQAVT